MRQRTLAGTIELEGVGLHSGLGVRATLLPAPANSGIVVVRIDLPDQPTIPISIDNIGEDAMTRQTTLVSPDNPEARVGTIEHILASLSGFGIDNCRIEINTPEAPLLDGSALEIAQKIEAVGVKKQDAKRDFVELTAPIAFSEGDVEIVATPADELRITFFLDYRGTMIGQQADSIVVTPESFTAEIAPARTFCLRQEIEFLRQHGLIKGGSLDNALVVDGDQLVNEDKTFRVENEFVRHKILDLIGDLVLLGRPLKAHVLAVKSGHRTHAAFVKKLKDSLS